MTPFLARFLAVLDASPANVAIEEATGERCSYEQLWERACAIAVGGPVILEKGRCIDHIAGMLAAMRAGVPFVPLDPGTPSARRAHIRDDIARGVSDEVAYVIYTSGSSGEPKGVEVGHDGLVPMLDEQRRAFEVDGRTRFYWMLSPGFDASISDIGVTLLSGGTLFCAPHDALPGSHFEVMRKNAITHVDLPPSLLALFDPALAKCSLRTIVIGGEVAPAEAVRRWAKHVRVVSVYGPTEATICTSMVTCDTSWDRPRIGRPLPHVKYEVRDGELWIGGPALARGYRDRALEAEKLVMVNGERFYRTGDRVAWLADRDLEFLGRIDRQLKVRGQLVEPVEVERRLAEHPAIARAAVVKHERAGLVAFVTARTSIDARAVRARLGETLPSFMVPSRIEVLSSLPELVSGKIDYARLTRQPLSRNVRSGEPVTEEEKRLVRLWASVLDRDEDEIGLDDDLALLGADSLALLRFSVAADVEGLAYRPARVTTIRALLSGSEHDEWKSITRLANEVDRLAVQADRAAGRSEAARCILLTGATGRVGRHVLARLLAEGFDVIALVRRAVSLDARVRICIGDLTEPRFGLDERAWSSLAREVDAIVHAGARVSAIAGYDELRGPNVLGTAHVIELARTGRPKALHHLSTLSVFVDAEETPVRVREDDDATSLRAIRGGYAQSKWVSEQLVRRAGLSGSIVRLGLVASGIDDLAIRFVRAVAGKGRVPTTIAEEAAIDLTAVDHVADALALLVKEPFAKPTTLHVAAERRVTLAEIVAALRAEGHVVERGPPQEFDLDMQAPLFDPRPFVFDQTRTRSFLEARNIVSPTVDVRAFVREALR